MILAETIDVADDLLKHFISRLHVQAKDIGTTAEHAGLDDDVILKIIATGLVFELIKVAMHMGLSEKDFVAFIRLAYTEARKIENDKD